MQTPECGKCGRRMEEGYLVDTQDHGIVHPAEWVEGAPKQVLRVFFRTRGRRRVRVVAWRCTVCGLVQLYAHPPE